MLFANIMRFFRSSHIFFVLDSDGNKKKFWKQFRFNRYLFGHLFNRNHSNLKDDASLLRNTKTFNDAIFLEFSVHTDVFRLLFSFSFKYFQSVV